MRFLSTLSERPFWLWMSYPEIATARALRWGDLSKEGRDCLEQRLLSGPPSELFGEGADLRKGVVEFYRDHELARVADTGASVSDAFRTLVEKRRTDDPDFPKRVDAMEPGREGVRFTRREDGDPSAFDGVPPESLLTHLQQSMKRKDFMRADDAEAFAKMPTGKLKIIRALTRGDIGGELFDLGLELLLSYPPQKADDQETVREVVEETAVLALRLPAEKLAELSERLSYWLDAADEAVPDFAGAATIWSKLLPLAAHRAQSVGENGPSVDTEKGSDLTMAALNEPLGHLLSFFLRRCPTGTPDKPPVLPAFFADPLKKIVGRARELMANRMAVAMGYFAAADRPWLDDWVIDPMLSDQAEGDRIWEAFAKYAPTPPSALWKALESTAYSRLAAGRLSPEARRRLTEMAVVIWAWAKHPETSYSVKSSGLKSALTLATDDVRSQAAWMFKSLIRESPDADSQKEDDWIVLGRTFFKEVWPLEPALQSPSSGNHFAEVPSRVGVKHFAEAVETVLPFIRPFEIWSVRVELGLDVADAKKAEMMKSQPEATLKLLSASIGDTLRHRILELSNILDLIVASEPQLERDPRTRALRRMAGD